MPPKTAAITSRLLKNTANVLNILQIYTMNNFAFDYVQT